MLPLILLYSFVIRISLALEYSYYLIFLKSSLIPFLCNQNLLVKELAHMKKKKQGKIIILSPVYK